MFSLGRSHHLAEDRWPEPQGGVCTWCDISASWWGASLARAFTRARQPSRACSLSGSALLWRTELLSRTMIAGRC